MHVPNQIIDFLNHVYVCICICMRVCACCCVIAAAAGARRDPGLERGCTVCAREGEAVLWYLGTH